LKCKTEGALSRAFQERRLQLNGGVMPSTTITMPLIDDIRAASRQHPTLAGPPRPEPPASAGELAAFEQGVGFQLPEIWRRIYTEVGDGGFGPGYGLLGLISGAKSDDGHSALELYRVFTEEEDPDDPEFRWPKGLVPVCHWGCAIYSCLDLTKPETPVVRFDPNGHGPDEGWDGAWQPESSSSDAWLRAWVSQTLTFEIDASPA
jgi:hypothetical protein